MKFMVKHVLLSTLAAVAFATIFTSCSSDDDFWSSDDSGRSYIDYPDADGIVDMVIECPDANHPHMIDLGLPSGTKWACCNVDTDHPENQNPTNYGGYYAWGETETKDRYDWNSYIFWTEEENTCHDIGVDIAGTQYDVAHVKWGGNWVMPSLKQIEELTDNCTCTWTSMNGVSVHRFTSPNGGSIFLPAAGHRWNGNLSNAGSRGYYWSSTQHPSDSNRAYDLYLCPNDAYGYYYSLGSGHAVRPVSK